MFVVGGVVEGIKNLGPSSCVKIGLTSNERGNPQWATWAFGEGGRAREFHRCRQNHQIEEETWSAREKDRGEAILRDPESAGCSLGTLDEKAINRQKGNVNDLVAEGAKIRLVQPGSLERLRGGGGRLSLGRG